MKKNSVALYPGSFDPLTLGHLDIIERASKLYSHVVIGLAKNLTKDPMFTARERLALLKSAAKKFPNVEVASFADLTVEFARKCGASAIVRGIRAVSDFEYEFQMALTNRKLCPEIETIFLMPSVEYSFVSSSLIKEIARFGGDLTPFLPENVAKKLAKKLKN